MTVSDTARDTIITAARAAAAMKGQDILAIDVSDRLYLTDAFLLVAADNERLVSALVDEIQDKLREQGIKAVRREGERQARWVLLDFGDVVVHVQHEEERETYALHTLWGECPIIELPDDVYDESLVRATAPRDEPAPVYVPAPLLDDRA